MGKFRYGLGLIIGTISAMILIFLFEMVNMKLYPLPAVYTLNDMMDDSKVKQVMALMPTAAFVSVILIYAIGSYFGGLIGTVISGRDKNWPSIVIGIILFGSGLWDAIRFAQPIWFMAGCLACIPFAWYGYYCIRK